MQINNVILLFYGEGYILNSLYEIAADIENDEEVITHKTHLPDDFIFNPHYHEGIEILSFFDGEGYGEIDGERIYIKSGDTVIFNSKQVHFIVTDTTLSYYCVIAKKSFLKKHNFPYKEKYILNKINDAEIYSFCKMLCDCNDTPTLWQKEKAHAYLLLLAIRLFSDFTDDKKSGINRVSGNKTSLVINVMDYISDNCEKTLSIEEIASYVGYSKYYLCRTFKELTNQTIIEYINRLKCTKAINDLKSGKFTVYETANKYGFENFSYFSETFKKYTGKSPSYYKKTD